MRHARKDYERIQDPLNKINEDEPVFLVRAQDLSGPETLRFWADETVRNGGDLAIAKKAEAWANEMERWQKNHSSKVADLPKGV